MPPEHGLAQRLGPLGRVEARGHHQRRLRRRPRAEAQLAAGSAAAAAAAVGLGLGLGLGLVTPTTTGDEGGRHVGLRRLLRLLLRRRPAVAIGPLARCRSVHGREALRAQALVTRARDEGLEQRDLRRLELHDGRAPLPRGGCVGRVD